MPRASREQASSNRVAIEESASRLFRERGFGGVSVAEVMADAGFTHGGFYGHFASKDELAAIACTRAFEDSLDRWKQRVAGQGDEASALGALIDGYLAPRNLRAPGGACPSAALSNDVSREGEDKPVRAAFVAGVKAQLDLLLSVQDPDRPPDTDKALVQLATMVGALVLARATAGDPISGDFVRAVRERFAGLVDEATV